MAGMEYYGDPFAGGEGWTEENRIGQLWQRFNAFYDATEEKPWRDKELPGERGYELHVEPVEYEETKRLYVMVGVAVDSPDGLPPELCVRVLPAGDYAVCTLKGEEIAGNWPDRIYKEWLPASGYEEAFKVTIERYDPRFKGPQDRESELDIVVPVCRSAD